EIRDPCAAPVRSPQVAVLAKDRGSEWCRWAPTRAAGVAPAGCVARTSPPAAGYALHGPASATGCGRPYRARRRWLVSTARLRIISATAGGGSHADGPRSV